MRQKLPGILVLLIAYFCTLSDAYGSSVTLVVAGAPERHFALIQEAINAAPPDATVRIAPGHYRENLILTQPLTLIGPGWRQATIGSFPSKTRAELRSFSREIDATLRSTQDREEAYRKQSQLMDSEFPPAIAIRSAGTVKISGVRFTQIPEGEAVLAKQSMSENLMGPLNVVWVTTSSLTMNDCAVIGSVSQGVVAGPASALNLEHCLVSGIFGNGVMFAGRTSAPASGSVRNCDVRSCYHYGISIGRGTKEVVIENCRISDTAWHGIRLDDCRGTIRGNRIYHHARTGIYISGATTSEIINNAIYNCSTGLSFYYLSGDAVLENTIADCDTAISFYGEAWPIISRNLFVRNRGGVVTSKTPADKARLESSSIKSNHIWQTGRVQNQLDWAYGSLFHQPRFRNDAHLEPLDEQSTCGARSFAAPVSPFPLQAEEIAILPATASRNFQLWTRPEKAWTSHTLAVEPLDTQPRASATSASVSTESYHESLNDLYAALGRMYPCFELKNIDWKVVGEELLPRAKNIKSDDEFGRLVMELVARLEDTHAAVLPGIIPLPRIECPQWSPGCVCLTSNAGEPAVYHVAEGSSAANAGIRPGMIITEVNGIPAEDVLEKTANELKKYFGYSSHRMLRYDAVRAMLNQHEQGTTIALTLQLLDGSTSNVVLEANDRLGYLPRLPVPIEGISDSADVSWKTLDDQTGYIYVRRIRPNLEDKLDAAVSELRGVKGMIIDVRGNSGGGFDARTALLNFDTSTTDTGRPRFTGPIAVLADSRCVSAGEGWASWFVANKRGMLFGEATAGASSRKTNYELKNGLYKIRVPVKAYTGFLDRPIERRGLEPNVEVRPAAQDLAAGKDTVLEAARLYLQKVK